MTVELTDEEFETVYEALRLANHPYSHDEIATVVAMEAKAWTAIQQAKRRTDHDG
jgi:hypothetical protein